MVKTRKHHVYNFARFIFTKPPSLSSAIKTNTKLHQTLARTPSLPEEVNTWLLFQNHCKLYLWVQFNGVFPWQASQSCTQMLIFQKDICFFYTVESFHHL
ncbi:hypothetical protein AMECASPLE_017245 [Ameca splendens]|uniref:Uncharacterized protein n=1 Tax=Ameca splendens TaxID=208324 RepID=A0ABV0ZYR4_9TELE